MGSKSSDGQTVRQWSVSEAEVSQRVRRWSVNEVEVSKSHGGKSVRLRLVNEAVVSK